MNCYYFIIEKKSFLRKQIDVEYEEFRKQNSFLPEETRLSRCQMRESLRLVTPAPTRYSKTIAPECRGKTSGTFRIDVTQMGSVPKIHTLFQSMPGEARHEWRNGGILVRSFDAWNMLPPSITETESEERRSILAFIANKKKLPDGSITYGKLPPIEAIGIELARLVLDTIPEWNELERTVQFIIEREIIEFINQKHPEFIVERQKELQLGRYVTQTMDDVGYSKNADEIERKRLAVIARITEKIVETSAYYEGNPESTRNLEDPLYRDFMAITESVSEQATRALEDNQQFAHRGILPPHPKDEDTKDIEEDEELPPAKPGIPKKRE